MSIDIAELLGFDMSASATRFYRNTLRGDTTFSCSETGDEAWRMLCEEMLDG